MNLTRPALLALLAMTVSAGCRTGGLGNLAAPSPLVTPRTSLKVAEVLAEHNRNAERVQTFTSKSSITITANRSNHSVTGNLAMERPRNFKLELNQFHFGEVADIGSNGDEFWFWVRPFDEKGRRSIYYCKYEDLGGNPQAATFQPDWIVEALGLRVVPDEELSEITLKRGREPGTLVLTHHASAGSGVPFTRETVLWESNRRIKEHRLYTADQRLLAQALVYGYQEIPAGPDATAEDKLYIPTRLKLEWFQQEKLTLDVTLSSPKANTRFSAERRQALFVEPQRKGYDRINLADMPGISRGRTTVRETRPAPAPRVRLGQPSPIGVDGARRTPRDPVALSADLSGSPAASEEVVGPRIPTAPEPGFVPAAGSGWTSPRIPPRFEQ
jgi:hypothetical protein